MVPLVPTLTVYQLLACTWLISAINNYRSDPGHYSIIDPLHNNNNNSCRTPDPESSLNRTQAEQTTTPVDTVKTKKVLLCIKSFIGVVFLVIVLVSSVLSKLTLVSLADRLRNVTYYPNASKKDTTEHERTTAVTLYWYLQFVLLIPNFITLVRCLAFGVIGKTTRTYPWPKARAIFFVSQEYN